jgi:hypothetical protein
MESLLRPRYIGLALGLALMLACFPASVQARMVGSMPAGAKDLTARQAREAQVQRLLAQEKVGQALASAGLTAGQVQSRLDHLSDQQLEELAQNLEGIQSGQTIVLVMVFLCIVLSIVLIYMEIEQI